MFKRFRKSFRSKKKKSTKERIPPRLQNRIQTPGGRVDCPLDRWSEGTISTSSFCYYPTHNYFQLRSGEQNVQEILNKARDPIADKPKRRQTTPAPTSKPPLALRLHLGGQCIAPVTQELIVKLERRNGMRRSTQAIPALQSTTKPPLPPRRKESMQQKVSIAQKAPAPKPAPRRSLQQKAPTPAPRRRPRQTLARDYGPVIENAWRQKADYQNILIGATKAADAPPYNNAANYHEELNYFD